MTRLPQHYSLGFKEAQALFSAYFTIKPNHVLRQELMRILPEIRIDDIDVREFYNKAITTNYPNETTIKASFLNNVLFKKKKDITIFEMPVGGSRVDLCKVNGTSIAYEIKTDIDNLKRLDKQLNDYAQVFEQVYVICSQSRLTEMDATLPKQYGIYVYSLSRSKQYSFVCHRDGSSNQSLNSEFQLSLLWKSELTRFFRFSEELNKKDAIDFIINHYSQSEINGIFKSTLKNRFKDKWYFLESNHKDIFEIDYQWFFQNQIKPQLIYGT